MAAIGRPNVGAYIGIPDMGAWQFPVPDGLRIGALRSSPVITGAIGTTAALTGELGDRVVAEGEFSADQL